MNQREASADAKADAHWRDTEVRANHLERMAEEEIHGDNLEAIALALLAISHRLELLDLAIARHAAAT